MNHSRPLAVILAAFLRGRFSLFLLTFIFTFLVAPLIPRDSTFLNALLSWLGLAVLASCLMAVSKSRRFFFFMLGFTLLNLVLGSSELLSHSRYSTTLTTLALSLHLLYYILVFLSIMGYVLDASPVTTDKICGALSAYFLIGIIWAVIYALFQHVRPESFALPESALGQRSLLPMWALYFSFTTLPSLGYGDITPQLPAVQAYAVMEAVVGQVFLTVLIARLVSLHIMHGQGTGNGSA